MSDSRRPDPVAVFEATRGALVARLDAMLEATGSPVDVAWTLADFAGRALDLEDCVVYLREGDSVAQYAAWGPKRVAERIFENRLRLRFGEGVVGTCALLGAPQLVVDTRADRRYLPDDDRRLSELAVPIADAQGLLGVLDTEHPEPGHYTPGHVEALTAFASRAAARLRVLKG